MYILYLKLALLFYACILNAVCAMQLSALMQLLCWMGWKGFALALVADGVLFCLLGQVQAQLEQTLEKLQGEQTLNQQLSAEVEQVQQCP